MSRSRPQFVVTAIVFGAWMTSGAAAAGAQPLPPDSPVTWTATTDTDADGTVDIVRSSVFTYQPGLVIVTTSTDGRPGFTAPDGVPDALAVQSTTVDNKGRALQDTVVLDNDADGTTDQYRVVIYTNDERGNPVFVVTTVYDASHTLQSQATRTTTWDTKGNVLAEHLVYDSPNPAPSLHRIQDITNVFNHQGHLLSSTHDIDLAADGVIDVHHVTTVNVGPAGRPVFQETLTDEPADGTIDETRTIFDFQFHGTDAVGFVTERTLAPATLVWRQNVSVAFDRPGRMSERRAEVDLGGDGSVDNVLLATFTFDRQGRYLTSYVEGDNDGDGFADQIITQAFGY